MSPGLAPPLRSSLSGCAAPIDGQAVLGLRVADRVAARERAAGFAHLGRRPSKIAASTSRGRSSGNAAIDRAKRTRPPIAKTSLNAFAAAISPNVRGSSTSGGKKSSVPMIARSSLTRYAAASSGGSRPAMRSPGPSSAASAPSPDSASANRSAPSLAAQPPQSVRSVRRIGVGASSVAIAPMIGGAANPARGRRGAAAACAGRATIGPGSGGVPVGPPVFKTGGAALGVARWVRLPRAPATLNADLHRRRPRGSGGRSCRAMAVTTDDFVVGSRSSSKPPPMGRIFALAKDSIEMEPAEIERLLERQDHAGADRRGQHHGLAGPSAQHD